MKRPPRLRGLCTHMPYTVPEAARAMGLSVATIRRWIKSGLPYVENTNPRLIKGGDLIAYLKQRKPPKLPCRLHECFCFKCRGPRPISAAGADYEARTPLSGNLTALCEECGAIMHKALSIRDLDALGQIVTVTIMQSQPRIRDRVNPSLNVHFPKEPESHA